METDGLLFKEEKNVEGKIRKYYRTTEKGKNVLIERGKKQMNYSRRLKNKTEYFRLKGEK